MADARSVDEGEQTEPPAHLVPPAAIPNDFAAHDHTRHRGLPVDRRRRPVSRRQSEPSARWTR